ncbi:hypothetical protein [Candidatus Rariloculus sp.]|uniref:hypothetical protein n=1 Tax=Candidatus Rariloculus sp. TaxID=3101265 RepID=UPI003D13389B
MSFLEWLQNTPLAIFVAETLWAYPLFETIHTLGMALLVGALGLIDLRVLGYNPPLPILGMRDLLPFAWLGFAVNLISGAALFTSDAVYFFSSYTFRIKMLLIVLAGVNAVLLGHRIFREPATAAGASTASAGAKWMAGSSLLFWVGAVIAGRLIAYTP